MEAAAGGRVLLELPGVSIPVSLSPRLLKGHLRVLQGPQDLVLQWEPLEGNWETSGDMEPPDPGYEPDWAVLSPPRAPPERGCSAGFSLPLASLWALRRSSCSFTSPFLLLLPRGGNPAPPPLYLSRRAMRDLLRLLRPQTRLSRRAMRDLLRLLRAQSRVSPKDPRLLLLVTPEGPPEPPASPGIVTRILQGPYAVTLGGLSRLLGSPRVSPKADPSADPEPPFEVINCVSLGPRPSPPRGPPVTSADWGRGQGPEGRSLDPEVLRERIFRGGLSPALRPQGWQRLLGLRGWGEPEGEEQPERLREQRDDYFRMKLQWRSLSSGQLRRNSVLRGYREQLERDLSRGSPCAPPSLLRDILMTFCMFNFDLGYVRGMKEVLTPLLSVIPEEVEAFWGFCSIMEMVGENFSQEGLERNLGQLGQVVRVVNPNLSDLLELSSPRRLCSQWLQLRFQRQLGMEGTRQVCEVLWTGLPCPNFLLLVTCALLELLGDSTGDTTGDSTGDTTGDSSDGDSDSEDSDGDMVSPALEVGEVLSRAEGIYLQLATAKDLPLTLQELLGLGEKPELGEQTGRADPKLGAQTGTGDPKLGAQTGTGDPKLGDQTGTGDPKLGVQTGTGDPKLGEQTGTGDTKLGEQTGTGDTKLGEQTGTGDTKLGEQTGRADPKLGPQTGSGDTKLGEQTGTGDPKLGEQTGTPKP